MEAMMASAILLVVVMSVTSAITAGQQHAYEAKQRIAAALAADELMCRLSTVAYADLPTWHGHSEAIGAMVDGDSNPLPATFDAVGRQVSVVASLETLPTTTIRVRGRTVRVQAFEEGNRVLCELSRFIPEPQ
jgi:hypothetical protein